MLRDAYIGEDKVSRIYTGEHLVHPSPVMDGLVLWYDFMGRRNSDAKRAIAEDLSGNKKEGNLINFSYQQGSGYNEGLHFDGIDDYFHAPRGSIPSSLANFSYSLCFLPDIIPGSGAYQWLLTYDSPSYMAFRLSTRTIFLSLATTLPDGTYAQRTLDTQVPAIASTPYHLTVTYNSGILRVYNLGVEVATSSLPSQALVNFAFLTVGRYVNDTSNFYKGILYSTMFYNRALTPSEVARNYQLEKERWNL